MSERTLDRLARVVVRRDLEIHRTHLGPRLVPHPHSYAQCVTYVIAGEFQHRDAVLESGRLDAGGSSG